MSFYVVIIFYVGFCDNLADRYYWGRENYFHVDYVGRKRLEHHQSTTVIDKFRLEITFLETQLTVADDLLS